MSLIDGLALQMTYGRKFSFGYAGIWEGEMQGSGMREEDRNSRPVSYMPLSLRIFVS